MENVLSILEKYAFDKMTLALLRQAAKIDDDYQLAVFIASAYNIYVITRYQERYGLITNLEALKINENEFQIFLEDFKAYVKDTIQTKDYQNERKKETIRENENGQHD